MNHYQMCKIDNCIDTCRLKMTSSSDFQRLQSAISDRLIKFNNKTTDLENLVQKIGTQEDSEQLRARYLQIQNETKTLMQQINADLKQLNDISLQNEADKRKKQILIKTLPKQYIDTMNRFQDAQHTGARKEKESLQRARGVSYQQNIDDSTLSNGEFQKQVVLPMEQHVNLQSLRERDEQLRQLETNIVTVNELFKDVARMVQEHREIIDGIENNIVEVQQHVEDGNHQLDDALRDKTAARRKKIMLYSILIIIVIILVLILSLYLGLRP